MRICPNCQWLYADEVLSCYKDNTQLPEPAEPGLLICKKYQLGAQLGAGGFGVVCQAKRLRFGDDRALKILMNASKDEEKAFEAEARLQFALDHPNIVKVFEFETTEVGQHIVVMELVKGESLSERLKRGPLPLQEAVSFTLQVCNALAHAHKQYVIHRDIKPQNLLIAQQSGLECVKLIDFGISKLKRGATLDITGLKTAPPGMVIGTPMYFSPEQLNGTPSTDLDQRSDLYSLGLVLYQMLTGCFPFHAEDDWGRVVARLVQDPLPLEQAQGDLKCPPELSKAVMKALARDREYRFKSAEEMAQALMAVLKKTSQATPQATPLVSVTGSYPVPMRQQIQRLVMLGVAVLGIIYGNYIMNLLFEFMSKFLGFMHELTKRIF